jgi:hypothetical protein
MDGPEEKPNELRVLYAQYLYKKGREERAKHQINLFFIGKMDPPFWILKKKEPKSQDPRAFLYGTCTDVSGSRILTMRNPRDENIGH